MSYDSSSYDETSLCDEELEDARSVDDKHHSFIESKFKDDASQNIDHSQLKIELKRHSKRPRSNGKCSPIKDYKIPSFGMA